MKHLVIQKAGKDSTFVINKKNAEINKTKRITSDNNNFEQINIEKDIFFMKVQKSIS